jgi:pyruvate dehydrogenase E2 component (dihydrolipoamide acetyltransferase)
MDPDAGTEAADDSPEMGAPRGESVRGEIRHAEPEHAERALARRSAESRATVPSVAYAAEIDVSVALEREAELGCGMLPMLVRGTALALRAVPRLNGAYRDGRYESYGRINIGVTMAGDGPPLTATVFDADRIAEGAIAETLADLRERARGDGLEAARRSGSTFTLIQTLDDGIAIIDPIVSPGQAATLAAGPLADRPVAAEGAVAIRPVLSLHLACDQRIAFPSHAAAFLRAVAVALNGA